MKTTTKAAKLATIESAKQYRNNDPATLADYAAYIRIETEADREARKARAQAEAARKEAEADPNSASKAAEASKAEAAAKQATKAAKEAAKTAPRYSFTVFAPSIKEAHEAAEAIAATVCDRLTLDPVASIKLYQCYTTTAATIDPAHLEAAAQQIAKRTAVNAVQREGTPTQYRIDNAARAREWSQHDLADMVSEAKTALHICATMPAADLATISAIFYEAAADLATISEADHAAALAVERRTAANIAAISKATAHEATADRNSAKRNADFYALCAEAAATLESNRETFTDHATRAAYMRVNHYLMACRSIHTDEHPAPLSLNDLDPDTIADPRTFDPEAITEAEAARRALLKAAFRQVFATLSPRAAQVFKMLYKGMTPAQISRALNIDESTTREHIRIITETTAAALAALAPEASETAAASVAAITAGIEAAEAAATLEARRKAATAAKAQAKAAEAKAEAADKLKEAAEAKAEAADRAAHIAEAIREAVNALTPTARAVYACIEGGKGTRETARTLSRDVKTISEHQKNITRRIAAAVMEAAPDIDPAIIEAADLAALLRLAK